MTSLYVGLHVYQLANIKDFGFYVLGLTYHKALHIFKAFVINRAYLIVF